ncbi:MAG TPA: glucose-6-phosphate dehydrogenase assembly protein OpcA, partial [Candidatus Dormibacteraeota bacterium]|nr:glucose-6-phosphate dehydrogenase assembly protein OpcA [Candidatus Dormibacteraeota bacterium]
MTTAGPAVGVLRTADASGLGAVERELAGLHRAMLRAGGDESRAVRLSVLTLVIACNDDAAAERACEVVAAIAAEHPARALLVTARRDQPDGIEAQLRLECSIRGGPESHVCAEIVQLRVGGAPALHLASVVQPLLLADVPVQLWLAGGPPLEQALAPDSLAIVERVILDSEEYADAAGTLRMCAIAAAGRGARVPLVDLAWLRLVAWREAVARAFD